MSIEASQKFNQVVKKVEFFPFEWSANLLAVCFNDSIKIFKFTEASIKKEDISDISTKENSSQQSKLSLILTVPFQQKIDNFSWNPKTVISSLKPVISFGVSDNSQNLIFYSANPNLLTDVQQTNTEIDQAQNIQTFKEKFDVDCIYNISFDFQNGEFIAFTGDNYCFLYDCIDFKLKARFLLQSPGINICWHRDEKTKFMVGEKSGVIRIFSLETLKPVYSIMCFNEITKISGFPLLSFDWSQMNPEIIIANTLNEIYVWNTSKSCLPEKTLENYEKLKYLKLCQFKDNMIGFIDGHDACSKLTILNFKSNQTIYQSKTHKLLNSFSFNSILPIVAMSTEQQVIIKKIIG